jgi:hypothetical protein
MNVKRLINTPHGQILLSIILALGIASLFRKVCTDKKCIHFNGPVITEIDGKIYKHGEKCYKYSSRPDKCDIKKRIIDIGEPKNGGEHKGF